MTGPTLESLDPSQIFYINTEWSKDVMVAVILKEYDSMEARKSKAQEKVGGNCESDNFFHINTKGVTAGKVKT